MGTSEQSAKSLRGAKMEDIIFSGAEHRKAQNFAEVKLKLDNHSQNYKLILRISCHTPSLSKW